LHFDIIEILDQDSSNLSIIKKYRDNPHIPITVEERSTIVRVAVGFMVEALGGNHYPVKETKMRLAEAIVSAFPQLGLNGWEQLGLTRYSSFYDPKTGNASIDTRLKTMRGHLEASDRKRKSGSSMNDPAQKSPKKQSKTKKSKKVKKASKSVAHSKDFDEDDCKEKV